MIIKDRSYIGLRQDGTKMCKKFTPNRSDRTRGVGIEQIIDKVMLKTDLDRETVSAIVYLQWQMVRSLMASGEFYQCMLPGLGAFVIKNTHRVNVRKGRTLLSSYYKEPLKIVRECDPFLRKPLSLIRKIKEKVTFKRESKETLFKRLDELGQRYYVLER